MGIDQTSIGGQRSLPNFVSTVSIMDCLVMYMGSLLPEVAIENLIRAVEVFLFYMVNQNHTRRSMCPVPGSQYVRRECL
jgi:hypothetical protein